MFFALYGFTQNKLTIQFSKESGKYNSPQRISLESEVGAAIYYTTNGNQPTRKSNRYAKPIISSKTTVIRAIALKNGKSSKIYTNTYFINEDSDFMLLSLTVAPSVLFDPTKGWLFLGPNADTVYPYLNANYWSRQEVTAEIEMFESDGSRVFDDKIGLKLFGGMSRSFNQKSFAIATRSIYGGAKRIQYQIFKDKKHKSYKHLVIRNSGSDCEKSHFRDAFITSLLDGQDIEKQSVRPCILYVNGDYWGIYYIRDKVNRHFIEYSTEFDDDSLDLIEHQNRVKFGSISHYNKMLAYMNKNDLGEKKHFDYIKTQMDVNNFLILQTTQIYIDNHDAGGNIKFWRPQIPSGRWRWVLYDTDWGFGLQNELAYQFNTLDLHTADNSLVWPNPTWSTLILRNLLENKDFEKAFVNRFCDYMNSIFEPAFVTKRINEFETLLEPVYNKHAQRWNYSRLIWKTHINRMKTFARERPAVMRKVIQKKVDVGEAVSFEMEVEGSGLVKINNNVEVTTTLKGKYFEKVPITLSAIPNYGHQFSHWQLSDGKKKQSSITISLKKSEINTIKAVFKKMNSRFDGQLVFNEIAPNNKSTGDWIELYNLSEAPVNLNKWTLRDTKRSFTFPNIEIAGNGYLVVCEDSTSFKNVFPKVKNLLGDLPFGVSKKKETLRLFASNGALIDSVAYEIEPLDSIFVMSLPFPDINNNEIKSWDIKSGIGTPAKANPGYQEQLNAIQQKKWWMIAGISLAVLLIGIFGYFRFVKST